MKTTENKKSITSETKKTTEQLKGGSELFDVQDFFEAFFEFKDNVPPSHWNKRQVLKKTIPHYHRYLRFEALCRAFGISSVDSFMAGEFIYDRSNYEHNSAVIHTRFIQLLFSMTEVSELIKGINGNRLVKDLNLLYFLNSSLQNYRTELSEIIDPDKLRISRSGLIEKYGFPIESIFEIDLKYAIF